MDFNVVNKQNKDAVDDDLYSTLSPVNNVLSALLAVHKSVNAFL